MSEKKHWITRMKEKIAQLEKECQEYRDLYLRTRADFENYKKAIQAQWKTTVEYSSERIVSELLPILDNFKRALNSDSEKNPKAFVEGVMMIYNQLLSILEKEGLKEMKVEGTQFDPRYHEAVSLVESALPAGTIVEEYASGYLFKDKLLRPAKVAVSRGQAIKKSTQGGDTNGREGNRD